MKVQEIIIFYNGDRRIDPQYTRGDATHAKIVVRTFDQEAPNRAFEDKTVFVGDDFQEGKEHDDNVPPLLCQCGDCTLGHHSLKVPERPADIPCQCPACKK